MDYFENDSYLEDDSHNSNLYSLNKRCTICNRLIKFDTICKYCYNKLENYINNGRENDLVHCTQCGVILGFKDDEATKNRTICSECFKYNLKNRGV